MVNRPPVPDRPLGARPRRPFLVKAFAVALTTVVVVVAVAEAGQLLSRIRDGGSVTLATPSPRFSPSPSPAPEEVQAWTRVRAALPSTVPVIVPTWLPPTIARDSVRVEALDPNGPTYGVRYDGPAGSIFFELGPLSPVSGQSAWGSRVRGVGAALTFPSDAFQTPRPKVVSWSESPYTYAIRVSEGVSGEDLMQTAWSVTSTSPPPPRPYPYVPRAVGSCSRPGMSAEQVVQKLLELTASGDPDAVNDCFAIERIEQSPGGFAGWARLGPVHDVSVESVGTVAGRVIVHATWTFERNPGGGWNFPRAGHFFTLGLDGGTVRVQDVASAAGPGGLPR